MAKKVKAVVKLQIPAGNATPAPPVGPALGQHGTNIVEFCKQFNERTKNQEVGTIIPAIITIYEDRSFSFITKMPPVSAMIKKSAGLAKAAPDPGRSKVGQLTKKQVEEIAKAKMADFNTTNLQSAMRLVEGTARSMGIEVVE